MCLEFITEYSHESKTNNAIYQPGVPIEINHHVPYEWLYVFSFFLSIFLQLAK